MFPPNIYAADPELRLILTTILETQFPEALRHLMATEKAEDALEGCGIVSLSWNNFEYLIVRLTDDASWESGAGIGMYYVGQYPEQVPPPGWQCGQTLLMRGVIRGNIADPELAAFAAEKFGEISLIPVQYIEHQEGQRFLISTRHVYVSTRFLTRGT